MLPSALILWLRHGAGVGGVLMGECEDMQGQSGFQEGWGSSLVGVLERWFQL